LCNQIFTSVIYLCGLRAGRHPFGIRLMTMPGRRKTLAAGVFRLAAGSGDLQLKRRQSRRGFKEKCFYPPGAEEKREATGFPQGNPIAAV
jgi:hypothetical protein